MELRGLLVIEAADCLLCLQTCSIEERSRARANVDRVFSVDCGNSPWPIPVASSANDEVNAGQDHSLFEAIMATSSR